MEKKKRKIKGGNNPLFKIRHTKHGIVFIKRKNKTKKQQGGRRKPFTQQQQHIRRQQQHIRRQQQHIGQQRYKQTKHPIKHIDSPSFPPKKCQAIAKWNSSSAGIALKKTNIASALFATGPQKKRNCQTCGCVPKPFFVGSEKQKQFLYTTMTSMTSSHQKHGLLHVIQGGHGFGKTYLAELVSNHYARVLNQEDITFLYKQSLDIPSFKNSLVLLDDIEGIMDVNLIKYIQNQFNMKEVNHNHKKKSQSRAPKFVQKTSLLLTTKNIYDLPSSWRWIRKLKITTLYACRSEKIIRKWLQKTMKEHVVSVNYKRLKNAISICNGNLNMLKSLLLNKGIGGEVDVTLNFFEHTKHLMNRGTFKSETDGCDTSRLALFTNLYDSDNNLSSISKRLESMSIGDVFENPDVNGDFQSSMQLSKYSNIIMNNAYTTGGIDRDFKHDFRYQSQSKIKFPLEIYQYTKQKRQHQQILDYAKLLSKSELTMWPEIESLNDVLDLYTINEQSPKLDVLDVELALQIYQEIIPRSFINDLEDWIFAAYPTFQNESNIAEEQAHNLQNYATRQKFLIQQHYERGVIKKHHAEEARKKLEAKLKVWRQRD